MSWLAVVLTALKLLLAVVSYLESQKLITAAKAEILSRHLEGALNEIKEADAVRAAVEQHFDADKLRTGDDTNRRD